MRQHLIPAAFLLAAVSASAQRTPLRQFTLSDLGRIRQPFLATVSPAGEAVAFVLGDSLYVRNLRGGQARPLVDGMLNQVQYARPAIAWSPTGDRLLVRRGKGGFDAVGTFVIVDTRNGTYRALLPDTLNARLQIFVHWAMGAPSWSPDGNRIAFVAADSSSSRVKLYVTDLSRGSTEIWAADTLQFGGTVSASWSPDGKWLAVTSGIFAGDAGKVVLLSARAAREERVLLRGAPMYYDPVWSDDSRFLAVTAYDRSRTGIASSRDGRKLVLELTVQSARVVTERLKLSSYSGWLRRESALLGVVRNGMSTRLAKENPTTGELVFLSGPDTLFTAVGSTANGTVVMAETGDLPRDIWVRSRDGRMNRVTAVNRWTDSIAIARGTIYRWLSAAGDTLETQLFLPPTGQKDGRVPLVVMPYGGYVNEFPKSEYFLSAGIQLLAARGFAVALPNTRDIGITGDRPGYGQIPLEDTELLLSSLQRAGIIDPRRVAVVGHSHGGALSYYYLTHSKSFCAVIPVNGWSDWSEIAGRLGGSDSERPRILQAASPILNAAAATAPLLAVSGNMDSQVLPHNAARMVDALRALGKPAELLNFPDEGHVISKPENRALFWQKVLAFLDQNCK